MLRVQRYDRLPCQRLIIVAVADDEAVDKGLQLPADRRSEQEKTEERKRNYDRQHCSKRGLDGGQDCRLDPRADQDQDQDAQRLRKNDPHLKEAVTDDGIKRQDHPGQAEIGPQPRFDAETADGGHNAGDHHSGKSEDHHPVKKMIELKPLDPGHMAPDAQYLDDQPEEHERAAHARGNFKGARMVHIRYKGIAGRDDQIGEKAKRENHGPIRIQNVPQQAGGAVCFDPEIIEKLQTGGNGQPSDPVQSGEYYKIMPLGGHEIHDRRIERVGSRKKCHNCHGPVHGTASPVLGQQEKSQEKLHRGDRQQRIRNEFKTVHETCPRSPVSSWSRTGMHRKDRASARHTITHIGTCVPRYQFVSACTESMPLAGMPLITAGPAIIPSVPSPHRCAPTPQK